MPREKPDSQVREAILHATRRLLERKRYDELTVADILAEAGVARGSFYFYFEGKADVLADLVRRAIGQGHEVAETWHGHGSAPVSIEAATRQSIADGARVWRAEAPVLRAIVQNWQSSPRLYEIWRSMMDSFTTATEARIVADRESGASPGGPDPGDLAAALTWLGERLYYLAATGIEPFDEEDRLVDVLTHIWMTALYKK
jgi:AcrR family transcriptional regulator